MDVMLLKGDFLVFHCPACNEKHRVRISGILNPWSWNGSLARPTVNPSVLVTSGHYLHGDNKACWCLYNEQHPEDEDSFKCVRCHSFIRNGNIVYLDDCSHDFAGMTIPLPLLSVI